MSLFLILWFADISDNIGKVLGFLITFAFISVIVIIMLIPEDPDEPIVETRRKALIKYSKTYGVILIVVGAIAFLLPSSKTIYIATGINAIQEATHSVAESDTAKKAIKLLNIKLDEYISESQETKK